MADEVEDTTSAPETSSPAAPLSGSQMAEDFASQSAGSPETPDTSAAAPEAPAVADIPTPGTPAAAAPDVWQERYMQQNQQMMELLQEMRQQRAPQAAVQQNPAVPEFNMAEFNRLQQSDPAAALRMITLHGLRTDPTAMKDIVAPYLKPYEDTRQQFIQQTHDARMRAAHAEVSAKFPEFKSGHPTYNLTEKFVEANPWVAEIAKHVPNVNAVELAYKLANYDNLAQQLLARDAKLVDKRATAGTVKAGSGNRVAPRTKNPARDAALDLSEKGIHVPEEWQRQMDAALNRF